MRKLTGALLSVLIAACGGSGSSTAPKGPSGTIGGASFSPAEVSAVAAGPATCQVADPTGQSSQPIAVSAAAVAVSLASYTGLCADLTSPFCNLHKDAREVLVLLASLNFVGGTAQVKPGTYTLTTDITHPTFDLGSGTATVAYASAVSTTATCAPAGDGGAAAVAQGTLRVDALDATHVAGNLNLTFSDGGKLSGDFSAPLCGAAPDICAVTASEGTCSGTPTCK